MNPRHLAVLSAICDTFLPSLQKTDDPDGYWSRTASDQNVPARILELIERAKTEDREQFFQLLDLLASPLLGLTWFGPFKPANRLNHAQKETLLRRWAASPIPQLRNAFNVLRKITALLYFGDIPPEKIENPNWKTIGYQQITQFIKPDPTPLPLLKLEKETTLECDVLVIGSGAGGSIVAADLAARGHEVLIVEKNGYTRAHEFTQEEVPMLERHFEAGGLLTSKSGSVTVLAGSTLGGGTTINWAGALRTPDYVLEEWATEHGNPHFLEKTYRDGFSFIEKRNSVSSEFQHNTQNRMLLESANRLDWRAEAIPMNMRFPENLPPETAWQAAGFSCYGDAYGIKQGAVQTFLRDAVAHGARILTNTDVQRIIIKNGEAIGAEGVALKGNKPVFPIKIKSKKVVLAAGALHSPTLLLKSGLSHPQIGRNLFLHPVVATAAFLDRDTLPWYGPMMSVIVQEFTRLDGNWGVRIECPPVHPGLAAFSLGWEDGESFKNDMANCRKLAVQIILARDKFGGRVTVSKRSQQPVIHYGLSDYDRRHLLWGVEKSVALHHAVEGVKRISVMHNQSLHFFPEKEKLEDFTVAIRRKNWGKNRFTVFSAHQMGTCRMGGSRDYPVKPNGETREVRNLYVADGSLFPSASGTNPMLSIQALAYWVGRQIVGR